LNSCNSLYDVYKLGLKVLTKMKSKDLIRVSILDDDKEFRELISTTIKNSNGFVCAGLYSSCDEAMKKIEDDIPDILLLDIAMPYKSGIQSLKEIKQKYPSVEVLMLTVLSDNDKIFESVRNGAVGYILKKSPSDKLLEAINEAYEGGAPFPGEIARKVLQYFKTPFKNSTQSELSDREREVLEALIDGHGTKAIADKLFVSINTIRFHLRNIYNKLHVNSRTEAVAKALKNKII
jgi:DNA-binding NarL/FixJ family response regulator